MANNLTVFHNAQQGILSYMVEGACEDITRDTVDILREANLMARYGQILLVTISFVKGGCPLYE